MVTIGFTLTSYENSYNETTSRLENSKGERTAAVSTKLSHWRLSNFNPERQPSGFPGCGYRNV